MRCRVQPFTIIGRAAVAKLARVTWTAGFLAAAPAMAAEVSVPAKASWQPPVVQPYDWTGLYVGAHLGYSGGRSNWSAPPDLASSLDLYQSSEIFNGSGSYFGGLQIGYDYMLANRVVPGVQPRWPDYARPMPVWPPPRDWANLRLQTLEGVPISTNTLGIVPPARRSLGRRDSPFSTRKRRMSNGQTSSCWPASASQLRYPIPWRGTERRSPSTSAASGARQTAAHARHHRGIRRIEPFHRQRDQ
jgi:hypothetical protein